MRDLSLPLEHVEAWKPLFMSELESLGVHMHQVKAISRMQ